jgi:hypothetical protein
MHGSGISSVMDKRIVRYFHEPVVIVESEGRGGEGEKI